MKRVLVYAWEGESQVNAIKSLEQRGEIRITKWLEVFKNIDDYLYKPFQGDVNLNLTYQERMALAEVKDVFFSMYSRISLSEGTSFDDLSHYYWRYVQLVNHWLETDKPDVVIISYPPHMGLDYVLYELCKVKNIPVKIFFQTLFTERFLVLNDIDEINHLPDLPRIEQNSLFKVEDFRQKEWFYMKKIRTYNKFCFLSFLNNFLVKAYARKPLSKEGAFRIYSNCLDFKKWRKALSNKTPDLRKKYIYFPLQLQPEMTTSTLGAPVYSDQLNAIEDLQSLLPDGWKIYVKENPKQTPRQRSKLFFKRLEACSKVEYICSSVPSSELIKGSQGVAVVTGTAGWEALIEGLPVITFGKVWYNSFPGVFQYSKGIRLEEFCSFKSDMAALQLAFDQFIGVTYEGVVDPGYEVSVDGFCAIKNQQKLEGVLIDVLLQSEGVV